MFPTKPPKVKLFAGGSTVIKLSAPLTQGADVPREQPAQEAGEDAGSLCLNALPMPDGCGSLVVMCHHGSQICICVLFGLFG